MKPSIPAATVAVFSLLSVLIMPPKAAAAERVALVIGNNAYPDTRNAAGEVIASPALDNCVKDATAVRTLLRDQLGFAEGDIIHGTDVNRVGFFSLLEAFRKRAAGARIAVFYFAGHGMEDFEGRDTFLLPVDADLHGASESEAILKATGVGLTGVLDELGRSTAGAKIVLLDCCRDRPKARTASGEPVDGGGLGTLDESRIPADTLILLAAAPRQQASDGKPGENGPFTRALLEVLPTADRSLFDAFFDVRDRVQELTRKQQRPWLRFDGSTDVFRKNALVRGAQPQPSPAEPANGTAVASMSAAELAAAQQEIAKLKALVAELNKASDGQTALAQQLAATKAQLESLQKAVPPTKPEPESSPPPAPAGSPSMANAIVPASVPTAAPPDAPAGGHRGTLTLESPTVAKIVTDLRKFVDIPLDKRCAYLANPDPGLRKVGRNLFLSWTKGYEDQIQGTNFWASRHAIVASTKIALADDLIGFLETPGEKTLPELNTLLADRRGVEIDASGKSPRFVGLKTSEDEYVSKAVDFVNSHGTPGVEIHDGTKQALVSDALSQAQGLLANAFPATGPVDKTAALKVLHERKASLSAPDGELAAVRLAQTQVPAIIESKLRIMQSQVKIHGAITREGKRLTEEAAARRFAEALTKAFDVELQLETIDASSATAAVYRERLKELRR